MNCEEQRLFKIVLLTLGIFLFGYFGGTLTANRSWRHHDFSETRDNDVQGFINPLLECDGGDEILSEEFRPSFRAVQETIDRHVAAGDIVSASVYFRDMNNGPWFGIGEDESYAASSMLKVAHMMAVFKHAEGDNNLLGREVVYDARYHEEPQTILPEQEIVIGTKYTVFELVARMIIYSDNEALYLLQDKVPEADADTVYADLGMEFTVLNEISVKEYSSLLRVLYNASYLSEAYSSQSLELLSQTTYDKGLRAGVPASVVVSHKFGERLLQNPYSQLHDCGIVYYPNHPYLLCVMTEGEDQAQLAATIQDISFTVYSQLRTQFSDY